MDENLVEDSYSKLLDSVRRAERRMKMLEDKLLEKKRIARVLEDTDIQRNVGRHISSSLNQSSSSSPIKKKNSFLKPKPHRHHRVDSLQEIMKNLNL